MADVFFSYAREDQAVVRELAEILSQRGLSCWWDREINAGENFTQVINKELSEAKSVIVVWSQHSIHSNWVIGEASDALDREILVPIAISEIKLPLPFRHLSVAQLINWPNSSNHLEFDKFVAAVGNKVSNCEPTFLSAINRDIVDPTLSVRVADRVAKLLENTSDSGRISSLKAELELQSSISRCALLLLSNQSPLDAIDTLLREVSYQWDATHINLWKGDRLLFGEDKLCRDLLPTTADGKLNGRIFNRNDADISDEDLSVLKSFGLNWLSLKNKGEIHLYIGSSRSKLPPLIDQMEEVFQLVSSAQYS